jgi:hypothetical protein
VSKQFLPFNLDTMSGVHPGTRTPIFQRVRVGDGQAVRWHLLQWYSNPNAAVLTPLAGTGEPLEFAEPDREWIAVALAHQLSARGQTLRTCGTCHWWQPAAGITPDGLRYGTCTIDSAGVESADADSAGAPADWQNSVLAAQSSLALECPHWQARTDHAPDTDADELRHVPRPLPKSAELDPDRLPWWKRIRVRIRNRFKPRREPSGSLDDLVERSGVGAGTEPCMACQGRIANLGAIAVASPDGDKQTYSVWRCRSCFSLFLNDWVDRWERLDSLETEETVYRLSPSEAAALLALIRSAPGAEHPARRHERESLRERLVLFTKHRERLSHQVRQGR